MLYGGSLQALLELGSKLERNACEFSIARFSIASFQSRCGVSLHARAKKRAWTQARTEREQTSSSKPEAHKVQTLRADHSQGPSPQSPLKARLPPVEAYAKKAVGCQWQREQSGSTSGLELHARRRVTGTGSPPEARPLVPVRRGSQLGRNGFKG